MQEESTLLWTTAKNHVRNHKIAFLLTLCIASCMRRQDNYALSNYSANILILPQIYKHKCTKRIERWWHQAVWGIHCNNTKKGSFICARLFHRALFTLFKSKRLYMDICEARRMYILSNLCPLSAAASSVELFLFLRLLLFVVFLVLFLLTQAKRQARIHLYIKLPPLRHSFVWISLILSSGNFLPFT